MKKKKNNSKKRAVTLLAVIWAVVLFLSVFSVLTIPSFGKNGVNRYNAPLSQIKQGQDISGGLYALLEVNTTVKNEETEKQESVTELEDKLSESLKIMQARLATYKYAEATVTKSGATALRVELPALDNYSTILATIAKPCKIEICKINSADSTKKGELIASNENIKRINATTTSDGSAAVGITLDDAGKKAYSDATYLKESESSKTLKVWLDGESYADISVTSRVTDGMLTLSGMFSSEDDSKTLVMQIKSGALSLSFKDAVVYAIAPVLGEGTVTAALAVGCILIALILTAMFVFFKRFGFAANLSLFIFACLFVILLATLPWVSLTLPGIAGIIVALALFVDANVNIFTRIKEEYRSGKSVVAACDGGFKKALWAILDSHAIALLASIAFWVLGSTFVTGFATTLFIGIILSAFCSLVFTRFSINRLLAINSTSPEKYNLKREAEEDYE